MPQTRIFIELLSWKQRSWFCNCRRRNQKVIALNVHKFSAIQEKHLHLSVSKLFFNIVAIPFDAGDEAGDQFYTPP